jgi:hypothetical protein
MDTDIDCMEDEEEEKVCADPYVEVDVEDSFPHPSYSLLHLQNDIGLIRIKGTANFRLGESPGPLLVYFTMPNVTENSYTMFPMPWVDPKSVIHESNLMLVSLLPP